MPCIQSIEEVRDLEGSRFSSGPPPPPSAMDWRLYSRSPDMWQWYCITATSSPVYPFKHVNNCTQNIQKDCHQWLSGSIRVHQIRFRPGLRPRPRWESLQIPYLV